MPWRGRTPRTRACLAGLLAAVAVLAQPSASLAAPTTPDEAAAEALFDDARRLMAEGRYAQACPKLEESERLAPGVGTKFHLADCNERRERTATAWAGFLAAAAAARAQGRGDREEAARERARLLEPKLPRLVIEVPEGARVPGLEVKRDGVAVGPGQWGAAIPVDPGPHTITASAPGKIAFATTVTLDRPGAAPPIVLRKLDDDLAAGAGHAGRTQRVAALVLGGAGLVGVGLGAVFGLKAIRTYDEAAAYCRGNTCEKEGLALRETSLHAGTSSTIAFVAGGVALAGGVVLWLTAPSDKSGGASAVRVTPAPTAGGFALALDGAF